MSSSIKKSPIQIRTDSEIYSARQFFTNNQQSSQKVSPGPKSPFAKNKERFQGVLTQTQSLSQQQIQPTSIKSTQQMSNFSEQMLPTYIQSAQQQNQQNNIQQIQIIPVNNTSQQTQKLSENLDANLVKKGQGEQILPVNQIKALTPKAQKIYFNQNQISQSNQPNIISIKSPQPSSQINTVQNQYQQPNNNIQKPQVLPISQFQVVQNTNNSSSIYQGPQSFGGNTSRLDPNTSRIEGQHTNRFEYVNPQYQNQNQQQQKSRSPKQGLSLSKHRNNSLNNSSERLILSQSQENLKQGIKISKNPDENNLSIRSQSVQSHFSFVNPQQQPQQQQTIQSSQQIIHQKIAPNQNNILIKTPAPQINQSQYKIRSITPNVQTTQEKNTQQYQQHIQQKIQPIQFLQQPQSSYSLTPKRPIIPQATSIQSSQQILVKNPQQQKQGISLIHEKQNSNQQLKSTLIQPKPTNLLQQSQSLQNSVHNSPRIITKVITKRKISSPIKIESPSKIPQQQLQSQSPYKIRSTSQQHQQQYVAIKHLQEVQQPGVISNNKIVTQQIQKPIEFFSAQNSPIRPLQNKVQLVQQQQQQVERESSSDIVNKYLQNNQEQIEQPTTQYQQLQQEQQPSSIKYLDKNQEKTEIINIENNQTTTNVVQYHSQPPESNSSIQYSNQQQLQQQLQPTLEQQEPENNDEEEDRIKRRGRQMNSSNNSNSNSRPPTISYSPRNQAIAAQNIYRGNNFQKQPQQQQQLYDEIKIYNSQNLDQKGKVASSSSDKKTNKDSPQIINIYKSSQQQQQQNSGNSYKYSTQQDDNSNQQQQSKDQNQFTFGKKQLVNNFKYSPTNQNQQQGSTVIQNKSYHIQPKNLQNQYHLPSSSSPSSRFKLKNSPEQQNQSQNKQQSFQSFNSNKKPSESIIHLETSNQFQQPQQQHSNQLKVSDILEQYKHHSSQRNSPNHSLSNNTTTNISNLNPASQNIDSQQQQQQIIQKMDELSIIVKSPQQEIMSHQQLSTQQQQLQQQQITRKQKDFEVFDKILQQQNQSQTKLQQQQLHQEDAYNNNSNSNLKSEEKLNTLQQYIKSSNMTTPKNKQTTFNLNTADLQKQQQYELDSYREMREKQKSSDRLEQQQPTSQNSPNVSTQNIQQHQYDNQIQQQQDQQKLDQQQYERKDSQQKIENVNQITSETAIVTNNKHQITIHNHHHGKNVQSPVRSFEEELYVPSSSKFNPNSDINTSREHQKRSRSKSIEQIQQRITDKISDAILQFINKSPNSNNQNNTSNNYNNISQGNIYSQQMQSSDQQQKSSLKQQPHTSSKISKIEEDPDKLEDMVLNIFENAIQKVEKFNSVQKSSQHTQNSNQSHNIEQQQNIPNETTTQKQNNTLDKLFERALDQVTKQKQMTQGNLNSLQKQQQLQNSSSPGQKSPPSQFQQNYLQLSEQQNQGQFLKTNSIIKTNSQKQSPNPKNLYISDYNTNIMEDSLKISKQKQEFIDKLQHNQLKNMNSSRNSSNSKNRKFDHVRPPFNQYAGLNPRYLRPDDEKNNFQVYQEYLRNSRSPSRDASRSRIKDSSFHSNFSQNREQINTKSLTPQKKQPIQITEISKNDPKTARHQNNKMIDEFSSKNQAAKNTNKYFINKNQRTNNPNKIQQNILNVKGKSAYSSPYRNRKTNNSQNKLQQKQEQEEEKIQKQKIKKLVKNLDIKDAPNIFQKLNQDAQRRQQETQFINQMVSGLSKQNKHKKGNTIFTGIQNQDQKQTDIQKQFQEQNHNVSKSPSPAQKQIINRNYQKPNHIPDNKKFNVSPNKTQSNVFKKYQTSKIVKSKQQSINVQQQKKAYSQEKLFEHLNFINKFNGDN